jgi:hypothetical protein
LSILDSYSDYDVFIEANINPNLAEGYGFGDSECDFALLSSGYISATTVLLHELVHGMGVYSILHPDNEGGFLGTGSVFDSRIRDEDGYGLLSDDYMPSARSLAGRTPLTVGGQVLFNPSDYKPGSSLSHFEWPYLMNYQMASGECTFSVTDELLAALREIGWDCPGSPGDHSWDYTARLLPMSQLGSVAVVTGSQHTSLAVVVASAAAGTALLVFLIFLVANKYTQSVARDRYHSVLQ